MNFFDTPESSKENRPMIPIPEGLKITENSYELVIERKWFSYAHIFTFFFSIAWNGFLFTFYTALMEGDAPMMFMLFPLIHVAVGIGLFYYSITGFFNKTRISGQKGVLGIRNFPLPWKGKKHLWRSCEGGSQRAGG